MMTRRPTRHTPETTTQQSQTQRAQYNMPTLINNKVATIRQQYHYHYKTGGGGGGGGGPVALLLREAADLVFCCCCCSCSRDRYLDCRVRRLLFAESGHRLCWLGQTLDPERRGQRRMAFVKLAASWPWRKINYWWLLWTGHSARPPSG